MKRKLPGNEQKYDMAPEAAVGFSWVQLGSGLLLAGCLISAAWSCSSRWVQRAMKTSWGPVQGCLVQTLVGGAFPMTESVSLTSSRGKINRRAARCLSNDEGAPVR